MCDQDKSCKCNVVSDNDSFKDSVIVLLEDLESKVNIQMSCIDDLEIDLEIAKEELKTLEIQRQLIYDLLYKPSSLFPS